MRIAKKDRNIDFCGSLYQQGEDKKTPLKTINHVISAVCFLALAICAAFYVVKHKENAGLEQNIEEVRAYSQDATNSEKLEAKEKVAAALEEAEDYYNTSKLFWEQLEESKRISGEYRDFFDKEMETALGEGNLLDKISYQGNKIQIIGRMIDEGQPETYAEHLRKVKDGEGNLKFADVICQDAPRESGYYHFEIQVILWEVAGGVP